MVQECHLLMGSVSLSGDATLHLHFLSIMDQFWEELHRKKQDIVSHASELIK